MSDFTHDGVTITLTESGKFAFQLEGRNFQSTSLAGAKSKIEVEKAKVFKPYTVLMETTYPSEAKEVVAEVESPGPISSYRWGGSSEGNSTIYLHRVTVARVVKRAKTRRRYESTDYYDDKGQSIADKHNFLADTPENIEAWKAYATAHYAEKARHVAAEKAIQELRNAVQKHKPVTEE